MNIENGYIVVHIHNLHLGNVFRVNSIKEGQSAVKKLAEHQLQRDLNAQEILSLENEFEVYSDDNADNVWSYCIGLVKQHINDPQIKENNS